MFTNPVLISPPVFVVFTLGDSVASHKQKCHTTLTLLYSRPALSTSATNDCHHLLGSS